MLISQTWTPTKNSFGGSTVSGQHQPISNRSDRKKHVNETHEDTASQRTVNNSNGWNGRVEVGPPAGLVVWSAPSHHTAFMMGFQAGSMLSSCVRACVWGSIQDTKNRKITCRYFKSLLTPLNFTPCASFFPLIHFSSKLLIKYWWLQELIW